MKLLLILEGKIYINGFGFREMDKLELIKRNVVEIIGEEELGELLRKSKKPVVYWGTMPTGSPHIAYYFPLLKIADFLKAGLKVKILISDLHAALDNVPWDVLEKRQKYYESLIPLMLKSINVDVKKLEFVKGSKLQLNSKYFEDVLKMSTFVSAKDAIKAASEVVKMGDNPRLAGLIYPIMQALDEEYLDVDIQLGGTDQRKIFVFARENLPKLGYRRRIEIMHVLIPGLINEKMSSSDSNSKIDMLDSEEEVNKKINRANCIVGDSNNALMAFLKYVIFVIKGDNGKKFVIQRDGKYGGDISYDSYDKLEKDFVAKKIHPLDLKKALAKEINDLISPIRANKNLRKLYSEAYG